MNIGGEGKSTLVKCIMGEIPFAGNLKVGHNVQVGYFAQNQAQLLDETLTVFDTIDQVAKGEVRLKIRDILGAFMFGGEASDKRVKVLSGGERSRLAMIKLLLEPARISRKFSDPSPLKDDSAWIWGASAEPGLGPTVRCSVSKHQPKARLGMHKKGGLGYIMQLRATVGKVSTPPPALGFNSGHSGS